MTAKLQELCEQLELLGRRRRMVLGSRIAQTNRLIANVASTTGYGSNLPEGERLAMFAAARAIVTTVEKGGDHFLADEIRASQAGIALQQELLHKHELAMKRLAKRLPVADWVGLPEQRGFGLLMLALVIARTGDLRRYANPGKVWRRMCLAPWTFDGKTMMGSTWRYKQHGTLPAEEWTKYGYSPATRSLGYLIGVGLVKQNFLAGTEGAGETGDGVLPDCDEVLVAAARTPGPYRARYLEAKATLLASHEGDPAYTPKRAHMHGMLVATKRLLLKLWVEWKHTTREENAPACGDTATDSEKRSADARA